MDDNSLSFSDYEEYIEDIKKVIEDFEYFEAVGLKASQDYLNNSTSTEDKSHAKAREWIDISKKSHDLAARWKENIDMIRLIHLEACEKEKAKGGQGQTGGIEV